MNGYEIAGIVIVSLLVYIVMSLLVGAWLDKLADEFLAVVGGILWFAALPIILVCLVVNRVWVFAEKHKIVDRFETIADALPDWKNNDADALPDWKNNE